jgi:small subunit ribosomal protein S4
VLDQKSVPAWLRLDINEMNGRVVSVPTRADLELPFDEQMVVEFYQR